MLRLKYFEIELSDGNDDAAVWICIKGTGQPSIEEAQQFMTRDCETFGLPVAGVYAIDEWSARNCYDFSNEAVWPVFFKNDHQ